MTRPALLSTPVAAPLPMGRIALSLAQRVAAWDVRVRTRRAMAQLDSHRLHDLGLTDADVRAEAAKPFWRD